MSRFVLTAQLQLQAPRNVRQVANQIQRQLGNVSVDLNIQNGRKAAQDLGKVNDQVDKLNKKSDQLGKTFAVSIRRFAAFSIVSRGIGLFTNKLSAAVEESIDFQRELIKIKQVSGATEQALTNLSSTITRLSTDLGTSSKDLLATSRILAQTGLAATQLETALTALAKTTLAPTFENIEKTAEGAVAILSQFGQGVGALETQLGAINAVAGQFAVESGDLISAVRRTGGVFKAAGGELNDLLALFTSVRATTRESSESIATGLRTIFTRIQRPATIEFMKQFGVELVDLEGKFIGPFEAVRQLSGALQGLEEGDIRFVQIAEELGGFRQIGKVIPLIQQFEVAERARQAAIAGASSLERDATTAQEALAVQIEKTRQNFLALIRSISETTSFSVLVKTTLGLADALIKVADALKPIVPLMAAFAGIKIAKGLGSFAGALGGGITTRNAGGPIGFATGGVVPGTGNRDTVPAMLTPGEFVIRKSSVNKIGTGTLAAMNENRFNDGGPVDDYKSSKPFIKTSSLTFSKDKQVEFNQDIHRFNKKDEIKFTSRTSKLNLEDPRYKNKIQGNKEANSLYRQYNAARKRGQSQTRGLRFEEILFALGIVRPAKTRGGKRSSRSRIDGVRRGELTEIKSTKDEISKKDIGEKLIGAAINPLSDVDDKINQFLTNQELTNKPNTIDLGNVAVIQDTTRGLGAARTKNFFGGNIPKYATGGPAPSDTVPALLTPGEFVINKSAASKIGRTNLDTMNKKGVTGFATGGAVGHVQKFADGGGVGNAAAVAFLLPSILDSFIGTVEKTDDEINQLGTTSISVRDALSQTITQFTILGTAMALFGKRISDVGPLVKGAFSGDKKKGSIGGFFESRRKKFQGGFLSETGGVGSGKAARGLSARIGAALGRGSKKGGPLGTLSKVGAKGISKTLGALTRIAGPAGIFTGALVGLNSIVKAGMGLQEKYNAAVKDGNVERSKELAVLKEAPALISSFFGESGAKFAIKLGEVFGGKTLKSIEANAEAQALAGKTTKEYEENSKEAAEALSKIKSGAESATEAFASGALTRNLQNVLNQSAQEIKAANENFTSELNRIELLGLRNFLANQFGIGETTADVGERAAKKRDEDVAKAFEATSKELDNNKEALRLLNREVIFSGGTFNQALNKSIGKLGNFTESLSVERAQALADTFRNQQQNIIDNLTVGRALNSSLYILDANIKGLNNSLSEAISKSTGEFDKFSAAISKVETVSAGGTFEEEEFRGTLKIINRELRDLGTASSSVNSTISKFRDLNKVTNKLPGVIESLRLDESAIANEDTFKQALGDSLNKIVSKDSPLAKALGQSAGELLKDIDVSDLGSDISTLSKSVIEKLASGANVDIEVLKALNEAYKQQAKLIRISFEAEEKLVKSKLDQITAQEESAKLLEEFGASTFTATKRIELLNKRASVSVAEGINSDAASLGQAIKNAKISLTDSINDLQASTEQANLQTIKDSIEKQRRVLDSANSIIRERINVEREALSLAKEKIKLDQQAIDNLLSGNIEDFLRQQEAAGARRALISGNAAATGAFSPRAIGEALKSIQDVDQKRRAADTAVVAGAITRSMADVLTGDTPEIKGIRKSVEEFSIVAEQIKEALVSADQTNKKIADEQKQIGQDSFEESVEKIAAAAKISNTNTKLLDQQISTLNDTLIKTNIELRAFVEAVKKQREEERIEKIISTSSITKEPFEKPVTVDTQKGKRDIALLLDAGPRVQAKGKTPEGIKALKDAQEVKRELEEEMRRLQFSGSVGGYSRGGTVPLYASTGIFVPRGTDTVPAMLTPGEFVVNRKSTRRGRNREVLESINRGATFGDNVYNNQGSSQSSIDTQALKGIASSLSSSFNKFDETVNRLINFKFEMTIAPTRVDVVLNTPQAMQQMNTAAKEEILTAVVNEISINQLGKLRRNRNA